MIDWGLSKIFTKNFACFYTILRENIHISQILANISGMKCNVRIFVFIASKLGARGLGVVT